MKITQRQLLWLFSILESSLVFETGFSMARNQRIGLWEEIVAQQSDEAKEISDEKSVNK